MSKKVLASYFSDSIGNHDNRLDDGGYYYAELSNDPQKKGDVGAGGPQHPKIDLHIKLATDLGFDFNKGVDEVEIEDA